MAALLASDRGAQVSGIDAAESLLTVARERVAAADFRLGDLQDLPFADGCFDVVTGFNSFQPKSGSYPVPASLGDGFGGPMTGAMRSLT
jgi:hypothetical protein